MNAPRVPEPSSLETIVISPDAPPVEEVSAASLASVVFAVVSAAFVSSFLLPHPVQRTVPIINADNVIITLFFIFQSP